MEPADKSVPELLSSLVRDMTDMFRKEGQLARAEISESINRVVTGGESVVAGAIVLLVAFIIAAQALVIALTNFVGAAWAAVIVAFALLVIGGLLLAKGKKDFENAASGPTRTIEQTRRDAQLAKEQI